MTATCIATDYLGSFLRRLAGLIPDSHASGEVASTACTWLTCGRDGRQHAIVDGVAEQFTLAGRPRAAVESAQGAEVVGERSRPQALCGHEFVLWLSALASPPGRKCRRCRSAVLRAEMGERHIDWEAIADWLANYELLLRVAGGCAHDAAHPITPHGGRYGNSEVG